MKLTDFAPCYEAAIEQTTQFAQMPSLWQVEGADIALAVRSDFASLDDAMQSIQRMNRLRKIFLARLENNASFRADYHRLRIKKWKSFQSPPVSMELQQSLADKLYNAVPGSKDVVELSVADGSRSVGLLVLERCLKDKVPVLVSVYDRLFGKLLMHHANADGLQAVAEDTIAFTEPVTKDIIFAPGYEDLSDVPDHPEKTALMSKFMEPYATRTSTGKVFYTLTKIPTLHDAAMEGVEYEAYLKEFFETCDQPWDAIGKAHEKLIAELDAGKLLHFTNPEGTDLTVDIDGFTFCNSLIAKNVPGSEVFSAPKRDGVNGRIVSKGRFTSPLNADQIIENIVLVYKNGRLISATAEKGQDYLEQVILVDEGARYCGEIALGTNPHFRRHSLNGLLVEKIGGSFHIALGRCYSYKEYGGKPVKVDNGNKSRIHWDVTTLLGDVELDGRKIMEKGRFLDPAFAVLNDGWKAIPREERPDYWKEYYNGK